MKDLYLVDGYNVIFGRPDIFDRSDLESCRKKLMDIMQDYGAHNDMDIMQDYGAHNDIEVIIAFDGKGNSTKVKVEELSAFFTIVYTPRRMTADSYIEKESYLRRDEYRHIFVVTSDGPEQSQILGNGAYRVSVSDLMRAMEEDKALQSKFITRNNHKNLRSEIGRAIPLSVQEKLDKLRGR